MVEVEIRHLFCCFEETFVFRFTVTHGESVDAPSLSAWPSRIVRVSLRSLSFDGLACLFIIIYDVKATVVLTYLMLHYLFCMWDRYLAKTFIPRYFGGVEQQFQIHHVVNDNGEVIYFVAMPTAKSVPRLDDICFRTEARTERSCRFHQNVFVAGLWSEAVSVAVTTIHHKADVVVIGESLRRFHLSSIS